MSSLPKHFIDVLKFMKTYMNSSLVISRNLLMSNVNGVSTQAGPFTLLLLINSFIFSPITSQFSKDIHGVELMMDFMNKFSYDLRLPGVH